MTSEDPGIERGSRSPLLIGLGNVAIVGGIATYVMLSKSGVKHQLYHYEYSPGTEVTISLNEYEAISLALLLLGLFGRYLGRAK